MIAASFEHLFDDLDFSDFESYVKVAVRLGSSDIHFEPLPSELRIRTRVEGELTELAKLPHPPGPNKPHPCIVQIKARSNLNLQSRVPEDGRFDTVVDGVSLSLRIATIPQVWGEKVVIRIFDVSRISSLQGLGFRPVNLERLRELVGRHAGIVLVTGPTGSGKTTTLYSILNFLNDPRKNIVTVEDPVEYFFYGINQIQVAAAGVTFQTALRALLRHDPDIIMIGEIRDQETAEIALHAAMTGHLVLTTVHARDAIGALMRLLDMGIPPLILSQAVNGVISQRLVQKLCSHCAVGAGHPPLEHVPTYEPGGCAQCLRTGYLGRQGIQEVLMLSDVMRKMLAFEAAEEELRMVALKEGMESLKEDAIFKSIDGTVSYREAFGITDEPLERIAADIQRVMEKI